jgi:2,4-dienoyl-CoA reductase-like NADH-dependent reductase (Old Yellow Enzyme family)
LELHDSSLLWSKQTPKYLLKSCAPENGIFPALFSVVLTKEEAPSPAGRITPGDAGIWADKHVEPVARINRFVKEHGAAPGIQIAHAGRKASAARPWEGGAHLADDAGGWPVIAPSALAFGGELTKVPRAMSLADVARV